MVPNTILCEDCGHQARVSSYGRIEYDWPKTATNGRLATIPAIYSIRLNVDCPTCGEKQQDFRLGDSPRPLARRPAPPPTIRFRRAK